MLWSIAFAVLFLALLIPVLAFVLDAPFFKGRRGAPLPQADEEDERLELLAKRLLSLEDEVDDLGHNVRELRDDLQYVQQLIDAGEVPESPSRLEPPDG